LGDGEDAINHIWKTKLQIFFTKAFSQQGGISADSARRINSADLGGFQVCGQPVTSFDDLTSSLGNAKETASLPPDTVRDQPGSGSSSSGTKKETVRFVWDESSETLRYKHNRSAVVIDDRSLEQIWHNLVQCSQGIIQTVRVKAALASAKAPASDTLASDKTTAGKLDGDENVVYSSMETVSSILNIFLTPYVHVDGNGVGGGSCAKTHALTPGFKPHGWDQPVIPPQVNSLLGIFGPPMFAAALDGMVNRVDVASPVRQSVSRKNAPLQAEHRLKREDEAFDQLGALEGLRCLGHLMCEYGKDVLPIHISRFYMALNSNLCLFMAMAGEGSTLQKPLPRALPLLGSGAAGSGTGGSSAPSTPPLPLKVGLSGVAMASILCSNCRLFCSDLKGNRVFVAPFLSAMESVLKCLDRGDLFIKKNTDGIDGDQTGVQSSSSSRILKGLLEWPQVREQRKGSLTSRGNAAMSASEPNVLSMLTSSMHENSPFAEKPLEARLIGIERGEVDALMRSFCVIVSSLVCLPNMQIVENEAPPAADKGSESQSPPASGQPTPPTRRSSLGRRGSNSLNGGLSLDIYDRPQFSSEDILRVLTHCLKTEGNDSNTQRWVWVSFLAIFEVIETQSLTGDVDSKSIALCKELIRLVLSKLESPPVAPPAGADGEDSDAGVHTETSVFLLQLCVVRTMKSISSCCKYFHQFMPDILYFLLMTLCGYINKNLRAAQMDTKNTTATYAHFDLASMGNHILPPARTKKVVEITTPHLIDILASEGYDCLLEWCVQLPQLLERSDEDGVAGPPLAQRPKTDSAQFGGRASMEASSSPFLPSFRPSVCPSLLRSFLLRSFLLAFIVSLSPSFIPSLIVPFLPSFLPLPPFLPSFLPSFLPFFPPSLLPAFLPLSVLPSFPPSFLRPVTPRRTRQSSPRSFHPSSLYLPSFRIFPSFLPFLSSDSFLPSILHLPSVRPSPPFLSFTFHCSFYPSSSFLHFPSIVPSFTFTLSLLPSLPFTFLPFTFLPSPFFLHLLFFTFPHLSSFLHLPTFLPLPFFLHLSSQGFLLGDELRKASFLPSFLPSVPPSSYPWSLSSILPPMPLYSFL
jgi:hypothetical protein